MRVYQAAAEWLGGSTSQIEGVIKQATQVIVGKDQALRLSMACLLADGHLLIEDVPGVGKTTLVKTLARLLGLDAHRVQFTNDLLPADIIGTAVFDQNKQQFSFHRGPIFAQTVIADELNRATPKTQSALLEAMAERRVSVDGVTYDLPRPFFVVATQNPEEQAGTYPLPESQLDRFLMRLEMGYPDRQAERQLLKGDSREHLLAQLRPAVDSQNVLEWQKHVHKVHAADAILDYIQDILAYSRSNPEKMQGLSPRSGLDLLRAAKAWALVHGRQIVIPEDVQAVGPSVMGHRLHRRVLESGPSGSELARQILENVSVR